MDRTKLKLQGGQQRRWTERMSHFDRHGGNFRKRYFQSQFETRKSGAVLAAVMVGGGSIPEECVTTRGQISITVEENLKGASNNYVRKISHFLTSSLPSSAFGTDLYTKILATSLTTSAFP